MLYLTSNFHDSMFPLFCSFNLERIVLSLEAVKLAISQREVVSLLPSHYLEVMTSYGIDLSNTKLANQCKLKHNDEVLSVTISGFPSVGVARFNFGLWKISAKQ